MQPLGDYTVQAPGISAPVTVAASEFQIIEGPFLRPVTPRPESSRTSDHLPGLELFAALRHPATGLEVDWRAVLREGASYLRQTLAIRSTNLVGQITRVQMLDLSRVPVVTL